MEDSAGYWFSDLDMGDHSSFFEFSASEVTALDPFTAGDYSFASSDHHRLEFSGEFLPGSPASAGWNGLPGERARPAPPTVLCFDSATATTKTSPAKRPAPAAARAPGSMGGHIIAERRRREKLSERFIALSSVVPGLKKSDKASVLGEAIKYVKQLQDKVRVLEERTASRLVESVVLVKKSQLPVDDECSCSDENITEGAQNNYGGSVPEIEVKVSDKSVLLRIHCESGRGVLVNLLAHIESFNLSVVNVNVLHFAGSSLDITVLAQMEEGFSMTVKSLVKGINSGISRFLGRPSQSSSMT